LKPRKRKLTSGKKRSSEEASAGYPSALKAGFRLGEKRGPDYPGQER